MHKLESLFDKFADIKPEILLDEGLHRGYFSMKQFYLKNTFLTAEAVVRRKTPVSQSLSY